MKATLKQILREKTYPRQSNHEQRIEYPAIIEGYEFYVAQKNLKGMQN